MGFVPSIDTYIPLLKVSARGGDLPTALLLFDEIQKLPAPSKSYLEIVYSTLLHAYAINQRIAFKGGTVYNNIQAANKIFERMRVSVTPTVLSLNELLRVYAEGYRINSTKQLYDTFRDYGVVPNTETYNVLLKMYCRTRRMERAVDLFYTMKSFQQPIEYRTYVILINGCARSHYVISGMNLIKEMKEKGMRLEPHLSFVLNFRRLLSKTPHLMKEIDELTGKPKFIPTFLKPGFKKISARRRELSEEEKKILSKEPKLWASN